MITKSFDLKLGPTTNDALEHLKLLSVLLTRSTYKDNSIGEITDEVCVFQHGFFHERNGVIKQYGYISVYLPVEVINPVTKKAIIDKGYKYRTIYDLFKASEISIQE